MHPCYRERLAPYLQVTGRAPLIPDGTWISAERDGVRLSFHFSERGLAENAVHSGATGDLAAVLEAFCRFSLGLPLPEIRDHGVLRLENSLRSPDESPPVPGLVTPENADPAFKALLDLTHLLPKPSETRPWSPPATALWRTLSVTERKRHLADLIRVELEQTGYVGPEVEIHPASTPDRWLLAFKSGIAPADFFLRLLSLERRIRIGTDPNVELFLEGKEDRNRRHGRDTRANDLHPGA